MAQTRVLLGHVKGDTGDKGDKGDQGDQGIQGLGGTLNLGTVNTGVPGSNAAVTLTGTPENRIVNFTIPQGQTGSPGTAGTSSLQFPPIYPLGGAYLAITGPTAYQHYENRLTIPDWSLADTNKIIFCSGTFGRGSLDTNYMLSINGLGARSVFFPYVARYGQQGASMAQMQMNQDNRGPVYAPVYSDLFMLRFTGSNFVHVGMDRMIDQILWREQKRGRYIYNYLAQHWGTQLEINQERIISLILNPWRTLLMPRFTGTTTIKFKVPQPTYGSNWNSWYRDRWAFNDFVTYETRKLYVRPAGHYATSQAGTLRIMANSQTATIWDESNYGDQEGNEVLPYYKSKTVGYVIRVAQPLIESGVVTHSSGTKFNAAVDIAYPANGDMAITYRWTFPPTGWAIGGLNPTGQLTAWYDGTNWLNHGGYWGDSMWQFDIMDVTVMQRL